LIADLEQMVHGLPASASAAAGATSTGNGSGADGGGEQDVTADDEEVVDAEFTRE
jgi:hypothetical protein